MGCKAGWREAFGRATEGTEFRKMLIFFYASEKHKRPSEIKEAARLSPRQLLLLLLRSLTPNQQCPR